MSARARSSLRGLRVRIDGLLGRRSRRLSGPILVHQMGKVASTAIAESLRRQRLGVPVHHAHELADALGSGGTRGWQERLRRHLEAPPSTAKWHVVTLVRDPVARNVSSYFHNLTKPGHPSYHARFAAGEPVSVDELLESFLRDADHDVPLRWFDREINALFDVDVFAEPFPRTRGFAVHRGVRADVAVLKFERLSDCFAAAVESLLGVSDVRLVTSNESRRKIYRSFLDQARLPDDYLDRMYESEVARHFYGDDELARLRRRWSGS